jgi:hypothetical protein
LRKIENLSNRRRAKTCINQVANQRYLELMAQEYGSMPDLGNRKIVKMSVVPGGNKRQCPRT